MRKKLKEEERKVKTAITIHPELLKIIDESTSNRSKFIEHLVYQEFRKNNKINDIIL
jgi:hypothetical protein